MSEKELKELHEMGYKSEEELLEEMCGCDENYSLDDYGCLGSRIGLLTKIESLGAGL